MATSWTQADLNALEAAIKTGVLEVQYSDRRVRYQSLSDMLKLRSTMKDAIEVSAGTAASRVSFGVVEK